MAPIGAKLPRFGQISAAFPRSPKSDFAKPFRRFVARFRQPFFLRGISPIFCEFRFLAKTRTFLRNPEIGLFRRPVTAIWPNFGRISGIAEIRLREAVSPFCCAFSEAALPAGYFADFFMISGFSRNILTFVSFWFRKWAPGAAICHNSGRVSEIAEIRLREAVSPFCCFGSRSPREIFRRFFHVSGFSLNILTFPQDSQNGPFSAPSYRDLAQFRPHF